MRREGAVDRLIEQNVAPGEFFGQLDDNLAGRAVAAVPGDRQRPTGVVILSKADDIIGEDAVLGYLPTRRGRRA